MVKEIGLVQLISLMKERNVDERILHFVVQLIRGKYKRLYKSFTNEIHAEVFKHLKKRDSQLIIAPHYVLLTNKYVYKTWYRTYEYYHTYIIGINTDGKLFINKLSVDISIDRLASHEVFKCKDHLIDFTTDNEIYELLQYDIDLESSNVRSLPLGMGTRYTVRLQGDLLMTVVKQGEDAYTEYMDIWKGALNMRIRELMHLLLAQRIRMLLAEYGITVEGDQIFSIPRWLSLNEQSKYVRMITEVIADELYVSDMRLGAVASVSKRFAYALHSWSITYVRNNVETCVITVRLGQGEFNNPYLPVTIDITLSPDIADEFASDIIDNLDLSVEKIHRNIGRHIIEFEGYPDTLTIQCELPFRDFNDNMNNHYLFTLHTDRFLIERGTLRISHSEHGTIEYTVREPLLVSFTTIALPREFIHRMNYYALKQLKKRKA